MNLCRYFKSFFNKITITDKSNINNFTPEKIEQKIDYLVESKNIVKTVKNKSCLKKIKTKVKWSVLHPLRNYLSNSSSEKRSYLFIYLFSWMLLFFVILMALFIITPNFFEIIIGIIAVFIIGEPILINYKNISLNTIFPILIFVFIYSLFMRFFRENLFSNGLSDNFDIEWFIPILCLVIVSFSIGFMTEAYLFWTKNKDKLDIVLRTLAALVSFVAVYLGRCIFVNSTGIEPSILSRPVIIFSVPIGILLWCCLSILILFLIYFLALFIGTIISTLFPLIVSIIEIINKYWYKIWLRKPKEFNLDNDLKKVKIKILFFVGGTLFGIASSVALPFILLDTLANNNILLSISQSDLMNAAQAVIVYIDYRPQEKFTECTNLEQDEWGLLVSNTKISVAQPQKLGGYIFTTKPCLFGDIYHPEF